MESGKVMKEGEEEVEEEEVEEEVDEVAVLRRTCLLLLRRCQKGTLQSYYYRMSVQIFARRRGKKKSEFDYEKDFSKKLRREKRPSIRINWFCSIFFVLIYY
jgi:hypothetical protein